MSVPSLNNRLSYGANGVTTFFAFPFYFLTQSDLQVSSIDGSGNVVSYVLGPDYSFSGTLDSNGVYSAGGAINFNVAPASGLTITIARVPIATQSTHWVDGDPDPAGVKETAFDKLTLLIQRLFDLAGRMPSFPDAFASTFSSQMPSAVPANGVLSVNAAGNGWTFIVPQINGLVGALPQASGGTGVGSVTVVPAGGFFAGWDTNKNMSANAFIPGYTTTVTAAGTTTLTVASSAQQFFTGSTTQTVKLPVASNLALGQQFQIVNASTGAVTVQSSGGNTISVVSPGAPIATFVCVLTSGTTAASWNAQGASSKYTPTHQTFTASGTYIPTSPNITLVKITTIGAGGGGGLSGGSGGTAGGGGGGGGGGAIKWVTLATIGASQVVTIGAAGAISGNGGTTSVGSLCAASGGIGGTNAGGALTYGSGGAAGVGTIGDILSSGQGGNAGTYGATGTVNGPGGGGGNSAWGFGGGGPGTGSGGGTGIGVVGGNYGGGASGASGSGAGATGAPGFVLIEEF